MSMTVGGVGFPLSVIELEQRVAVLEIIIEHMSAYMQVPVGSPPFDVEAARQKAFEGLQKKYPELGLQTK